MNYLDSIIWAAWWMQVTPEEIMSSTRKQPIAWARQVAMYLEWQMVGGTKTAVGERFRRDRTTVRHAIDKVDDFRGQSEDFDAKIASILTGKIKRGVITL